MPVPCTGYLLHARHVFIRHEGTHVPFLKDYTTLGNNKTNKELIHALRLQKQIHRALPYY